MAKPSEPEVTRAVEALTSDVGRLLSSPTKSQPFLATRTPRWILRAFDAFDANISVSGGVYQVNRVQDSVAQALVNPGVVVGDRSRATTPPFRRGQSEGEEVKTWLGLYDPAPKLISLEVIQAIVRTMTLVPALFSDSHDQLQWQFNTIAELIIETKEDLAFNHPEHGLLHSVDSSMELEVNGPPSLDVLDDLLARAWKRPDCFVMHPLSLALLRKEATARSLTLEEADLFETSFTLWRGLPIFPSDKLRLVAESTETGNSKAGSSTTDVIVMRLGKEHQGVVSLSAADATEHPTLPSISVEFMGLSDTAVASYLLTTYSAVAVLSPGALARARVTI